METPTASPSSSSHPTSSRVSVGEGPDGRALVRISGALPVGWMGALSLGIGEAGFSIVRASARRREHQHWEVTLELAPSVAAASKATALDYLSLAARRRHLHLDAPLPIVIESYALDRDEARGIIVLDLKGVDRVGFLGSLLERLAGLLLFPVEMEVETVGPYAIDRFCLQAIGGQAPSPEAERKLLALLDRLR